MSENKVKLQLSRNISLNDKSPSPSKLMINHGKPNFTINRQTNNYKKFNMDTEPKSKEMDKVVLKNVSLNGTASDKNAGNKLKGDDEFLEQFKKISTKTQKVDRNVSTENKIPQKQEFLEKYHEISEKFNNRDFDSKDTPTSVSAAKINGNGIHDTKTPNENGTKKPPHFAKMVDSRLQNAEIKNTGFKLPPGAICGKPFIPAKPAGLIPTTPTAVISNGHGNNQPASIITNNKNNTLPKDMNAANFEQKTVVSFSRDLSAAPNTYPDMAKVVINELKSNIENSEVLNEIGKLKFDIETTGNDVTVTPVIR